MGNIDQKGNECVQKEKFTSFHFYVLTRVKKDKMVAESVEVQIKQRKILV